MKFKLKSYYWYGTEIVVIWGGNVIKYAPRKSPPTWPRAYRPEISYSFPSVGSDYDKLLPILSVSSLTLPHMRTSQGSTAALFSNFVQFPTQPLLSRPHRVHLRRGVRDPICGLLSPDRLSSGRKAHFAVKASVVSLQTGRSAACQWTKFVRSNQDMNGGNVRLTSPYHLLVDHFSAKTVRTVSPLFYWQLPRYYY